MHKSRYLWVMLISLVCIVGILSFKTPDKVWTAISVVNYVDSPEALINRFWKLVDQRQFSLAKELIAENVDDTDTIVTMNNVEGFVSKNPMLSLRKTEIIQTGIQGVNMVRIVWLTEPKSTLEEIYLIQVKKYGENYKVVGIKRADKED